MVRRKQDAVPDSHANKISLAFSVENRPGSLVAALSELSAVGTNLTKIESRPVHGKPWEYIFYVDCQIQSAEEGGHALDALRPHCAMVKELGRYREADS
jgi:prephenate dehydratase